MRSALPPLHLIAYAVTAIPLAMIALPVYVHVPKFYAEVGGLDLTVLGGLLLSARLVDALQDPVLGYYSDRMRLPRRGRLGWVLAGVPVLAVGALGLFNPPAAVSPGIVSAWLFGMLCVATLGLSAVQISYHAHGAELSSDAHGRARVTAYREGCALLGVLLGVSLPELLSEALGPRAGFARFALLFVGFLVVAAAITYAAGAAPAAPGVAPGNGPWAAWRGSLRNRRFRALLAVFILNGIAAAIPATLVLFFISDVIGRADLAPYFLGAYFAAGALSMPVWPWLARRWGKAHAWRAGMLLSVGAFGWAAVLGADDTAAFLVICVMSGVGLGADLALPPALLADVIDDDAHLAPGRREGAYFGLWNFVNKLNLALAAGIALPLAALFGYVPGTGAATAVPNALSLTYAALPCVLKGAAVAMLARSPLGADSSGSAVRTQDGRMQDRAEAASWH